MSLAHQFSILKPLPNHGRSLSFAVRLETDPAGALRKLAGAFNPAWGGVSMG
ncbi:MAG TPA: hypothetical protein VMU18_10245 [Rhodoblastus sp.]|nr:hypothetical protein [Rhodoblastus sp.]